MSRSLGSIVQPTSPVPAGQVVYEAVLRISNLIDTVLDDNLHAGIEDRLSIFVQVQGADAVVVFSCNSSTTAGGVKLAAGDPGGSLYDSDSQGPCSLVALGAPVSVYVRVIGE